MAPIKEASFLYNIQPVLFLGKCFGIVFFNVFKTKSKLIAFIGDAICLLLICCFLRWNFTATATVLSFKHTKKNNLNIAIDIAVQTCIFCTVLFRHIFYFVLRNDMEAFLTEIDKLDELTIVNRRESLRIKRELILYIAICIISVAFAFWVKSASCLNIWCVEISLYYYLNDQYCFFDLFFRRTVLKEINDIFSNINDKIRSSNEVQNMEDFIPSTRRHLKLTRLIFDNNDLLNTTIFATFLTLFALITTLTATTASTLRAWFGNHEVNWITFGWNLFVALKSWVFIWMALRTPMNVVSEAQKTSTYIHDVWNKWSSRGKIDPRLKHLQLISLQLYNSRLTFTAHGFFKLDWTLLQRIISAVATYVVIFVQFEISSPMNDDASSNSTAA